MDEADTPQNQVLLLECNIDDMTGEALGFAMERLLAAGALDAWFTPIYMKKNRPAVTLSVLCPPEQGATFQRLLLTETTTLGVRWQLMAREVTERRTDCVTTPWGIVHRKLKLLDGEIVSVKPEFEDCARLARQHGIPLQQVLTAAQQAPIAAPPDEQSCS